VNLTVVVFMHYATVNCIKRRRFLLKMCVFMFFFSQSYC